MLLMDRNYEFLGILVDQVGRRFDHFCATARATEAALLTRELQGFSSLHAQHTTLRKS